ncbi:MAG: hypothetical protein Q9187_001518 [Circinaria calcarea]
MTMGIVEELAAEIRRVVTSPYSVSLKPLHDILHHAKTHDLRDWADGNGCQLNGLAAAVLEELQIWPYTLDIIQKLAPVTAFRDALLRQKPALLIVLLDKAGQSDPDANPQYEKTCISMLLTCLPEGYAVPAALPAFLLRILDKASESPSVITVKPLYSLITGVGTGFLDILPPRSIIRLQEQLTDIISRSVQDPSVSLLCLAVLAKIAADGDEEVDQEDSYYLAKRFFNKRASKTLDLVVLWAVQMCSRTTSENTDGSQAMENLKLAAEIIRAVNAHARSTWIALPKNLLMTRRLQGKILCKEANHDVRIAVLAIMSSLDDMASLPEELVSVLESTLEWSPLPHGAEAVIEQYAGQFSAKVVLSLLTKLLTTSKHCTYDTNIVVDLKAAMSISFSLAGAIKTSSNLRKRLTIALMSNDLQGPLQRFLAYKRCPERVVKHTQHESCPCIIEDNQRRLHYSICTLLLKSSLSASASETRIDPSLASSLLTKLETLSVPSPGCLTFMAHESSREGSLSPVELGGTPINTKNDRSWRGWLKEQLLQESAQRYETVVQTMDRVCRDLETRCNTVEQPLREEQARSNELASQLETLKTENSKLEIEAQEYRMVLDGLESEKKGFTDRIEDAEIRLERSLGELQNLQRMFEHEKQQAAADARRFELAANQRELEYLATKAADDETIDEQISRLLTLQEELEAAEAKVATLGSEASTSRRRKIELEMVIHEYDVRSTETDMHMRKTETEMARLLQVELDQSRLVESLRSQIEDLLTAAKKAEVELTDNVACLRLEISDMQRKHDNDLAHKDSQLAEQEGRFNQTIMQLQRGVDEGREEATAKAKHHQRVVSGLEEKIRKLRKECDKHVRESAEAQIDMKNRMMAAIGVQPGLSTAERPQVQVPLVNASEKSPFVEDQIQQSPTQDLLRSFAPSVSSRSGSTPKRSKPRRSMKTPIMQQSRVSMGHNTVRGARGDCPRSQRQPLKDLGFDGQNKSMPSPNQLASKFGDDNGPSTPGEVGRDGHIYDADGLGDLSFEDSNVFASTDHRREDKNGCSADRDIYDETTADFGS